MENIPEGLIDGIISLSYQEYGFNTKLSGHNSGNRYKQRLAFDKPVICEQVRAISPWGKLNLLLII